MFSSTRPQSAEHTKERVKYMNHIKIAIVGIGNCASSLIQGIHYYRQKASQDAIGLMHWEIGGYSPGDIEVVMAIDIDQRKVGVCRAGIEMQT